MIRLFLLSIAGCFAFGFSNRQTSYEITYANDGVYEPVSRYASKIILRRFRQRLLINEKLSYFYNLWNDSDPLKRKNIDSFELNNSNYYNSTNGVIYTVKVLPREIGTLLVADSLAEEDWIFTNEKKKIKGYNCKLVCKPVDNKDTIFVWYTEEIPLPFGPAYYVGFPGLVLQVEDIFHKTRITTTEIKEKPLAVYWPLHRIIARKEFHELYE